MKTSASYLYADFGAPKSPTAATKSELSEVDVEDLKLEAFESGFAAGWDEAVKAHKNGSARQSEEILEALQAATFSVHEARRGLLDGLTPLFVEITRKLLPAIAQQGLGLHVAEQLKQMSAAALDQDLEVEIAPQLEQSLRELLEGSVIEPVHVTASPDTSSLAARLRVGNQEREIDFEHLLQGITDALTAAAQALRKDPLDGR